MTTNTGTASAESAPPIRLWSQLKGLFASAENTAGKDFGEVEQELGRPLYPISPYLSQVSPELWRGSWPTIRALAELQKQNVKTIANLCAERPYDPRTRATGFFVANISIVDNTAPTLADVTFFLHLIETLGPVFVHCEEGKGRTGCMVAAYRVKVQGWTPINALSEAVKFGLVMPCQKDFILGLC